MIRIFVDFDGTITRRDVGDALFERFGGETSSRAIREYRQGSLSAVECFKREAAACGTFLHHEMDAFLDTQEIDHSFGQFLQFARERELDVRILSDGMDYYIRRILSRYGLEVPFFTNHLELLPDGVNLVRMAPSFPSTDEVCDRCAFCKRNHMLTHSAEEDILVYVGEGYSDRCPARYADCVFAKDELRDYCRQEGIPFYEYRSFTDVTGRLRSLLDESDRRGSRSGGKKNLLRKRRQAQEACRAAFTGG